MRFRTAKVRMNAVRPSARPGRLFLVLASVGLLAAACVQESGAYPIEIFTEMHYSPAFRSQETPRLGGVESAVVYKGAGDAQQVVDILPANVAHPYDAVAGAELYRVNCSACHGIAGLGDGRAAAHISSPNSAWVDQTGATYGAPPNLQVSRTRIDQDTVFAIVTNGVVVMPRFGPLLSEEQRWDIVRYIFDETPSGLGR